MNHNVPAASLLCAAGGRPEQNIALLHLDERGKDRLPTAGGTAAGQSAFQPGREVHRDGRRRGQHRLGQHEGERRRRHLWTLKGMQTREIV